MKILEDLLKHLTPSEEALREVIIGAHWTTVLTRGCGLASTLGDHHPHTGPSVRDAGKLTERGVAELMNLAHSEKLLEASIGMATINSLVEIDEERYSEVNAFDVLAQQGEGKDVAIIGHFPFVPKLKKIARNLWIIEQRPHPGDLEAERATDILPRCQVVGITSTSFINHTLESLLDLCRDAFVMLLGPTTPFTPLLFDYGIDALSGTQVVDENRVIRHVKEGATFQQIHHAGVRLLTMTK
ncbi:MAG: DUF364 domain-containing protein [Deltaproteobacteria bacterium]|nr:DUF364 domain-containing protein [Deltaproteobacteria bacterium]